MLTYVQAIILGAIQGVTELFPISSLGHSVIVPTLLKWPLDQHDASFLTFLVATHLATAIVLFFFFLDDWIKIIGGMIRSIIKFELEEKNIYGRLGWLLVIGTIPAGILGLLFQKKLEILFASAGIVSVCLIVNGIVLYCAEKFISHQTSRASAGDVGLSKMSFTKSFGVGLMQALALIPGLSRTGSTLTGGMMAGFDRQDSARFAFLLATPIIFAAAILKLPSLFHAHATAMGQTVVGAMTAALAAYISVKFLTRYFKNHTLTPFAIYCVIAGILSISIMASFHGVF